jgi:hypothetical protein
MKLALKDHERVAEASFLLRAVGKDTAERRGYSIHRDMETVHNKVHYEGGEKWHNALESRSLI